MSEWLVSVFELYTQRQLDHMHNKADDSQLVVSGGGIQIKPSQARFSRISHECDAKAEYQI